MRELIIEHVNLKENSQERELVGPPETTNTPHKITLLEPSGYIRTSDYAVSINKDHDTSNFTNH